MKKTNYKTKHVKNEVKPAINQNDRKKIQKQDETEVKQQLQCFARIVVQIYFLIQQNEPE